MARNGSRSKMFFGSSFGRILAPSFSIAHFFVDIYINNKYSAINIGIIKYISVTLLGICASPMNYWIDEMRGN